MRIRFLYLLLFASGYLHAQPLDFRNGYIPEGPPHAETMVAYLDIHNPGKEAVTINSIVSADFNAVEMHETVIENGIAKMNRHEQLNIAAGETVHLQPGGFHLMLFGPRKRFLNGELVQFEITQTDGTRHIIEISIKNRRLLQKP